MTGAPASFDAIMAPLGADVFLHDYHGRAPLHLEGPPEKWQAVMNWDVLNRLLGTTTVWSHQSLLLFHDKEAVPYAGYTSPAPGRDGGQVLRPDPARVKTHLARGATLVLNDIDQLTPELSAFSRVMEEALGAKLQANLYLSSKRKQGFKVHYDTHDVFAVHVMGEKTWMVFEGRADNPIAHPAFKGLGDAHHDAAKGALWKEVRLRPGDLLYLPRGQYHYALADEGACAHIAFGATHPIGLDAVTYLFERLVHEPLARANLPYGDPAALRERLAALGERLRDLVSDEKACADVAAIQAAYRYPREGYDLPGLVDGAAATFVVRRRGLRLVEQGGKVGLVREGSRQAMEVPASIKPLLTWTLGRDRFAKDELGRAFAGESAARIEKFIADAGRMGILERAP